MGRNRGNFRRPRRSRAPDKAEDLREAVRAGLPLIALHSLQESLQLSRESLSRMLSMPERTLARRQKQARLTADESDRVVRVARVMAHAIQVLGSRDKAAQWFRTANRALDGTAPISAAGYRYRSTAGERNPRAN